MDLGNTVIMLGIIALLVMAIAIVFVLYDYSRPAYDIRKIKLGKVKGEPTIILDEKEDVYKCDICYGNIDDDEVTKCLCGKVFHRACAKPTEFCPYCQIPFEKMDTRSPEVTRCPDPRCRKPIKGSVCTCGMAAPRRDGTLICTCGENVDAAKPVCKKCGAVYEFRPMLEFIKIK